jgi:hypothetical protein
MYDKMMYLKKILGLYYFSFFRASFDKLVSLSIYSHLQQVQLFADMNDRASERWGKRGRERRKRNKMEIKRRRREKGERKK